MMLLLLDQFSPKLQRRPNVIYSEIIFALKIFSATIESGLEARAWETESVRKYAYVPVASSPSARDKHDMFGRNPHTGPASP
jgi:uncharacterized protein (DUF924 family)